MGRDMGPILSNIELLKAEVRTWHGFSERLEREKQELHYRLQIAEEALKKISTHGPDSDEMIHIAEEALEQIQKEE